MSLYSLTNQEKDTQVSPLGSDREDGTEGILQLKKVHWRYLYHPPEQLKRQYTSTNHSRSDSHKRDTLAAAQTIRCRVGPSGRGRTT